MIAELNKAVNEVLPSLEAQMIREGADPAGGTPEQFAQFVQKEYEKWKVIVQRLEGDRRVASAGNAARPLRLLLSSSAARDLSARVSDTLGGASWIPVAPGDTGTDFDVAFVSRDVTGLSTKHEVQPATQVFYDALLAAPSLQWVHVHSAGADRPVYVTLRERGVQVTTSSGANAPVVAVSAWRGSSRSRAACHCCWTRSVRGAGRRCLHRSPARPGRAVGGCRRLGPDRAADRCTASGTRSASRSRASVITVGGRGHSDSAVHAASQLLPQADWLVLCCPLSAETRYLVDRRRSRCCRAAPHVVNVARGDVVDEDALIAALRSGALAGAYLDVFAHEPLPSDSPLWTLPNVIVTPHSAGFSDGNEERVARMFLDNLGRWARGEPLAGLASEF